MSIEDTALQGEEALGIVKEILKEEAKDYSFKSRFKNPDGTDRPDYTKVRVPLRVEVDGKEIVSISIFLPKEGDISPNSATGRILKSVGAKTVGELVGKQIRLRKQGNFWRIDF